MSDESNEKTPQERADIFRRQSREDMVRFLDFQFQASGNAAKILSILNGGLAVSIATWFQSSLASGASVLQQSLIQYFAVGIVLALAGLCFTALLPLCLERNVAHSVIASARKDRVARGITAPPTGDPVTDGVFNSDLERVRDSLAQVEFWNKAWSYCFWLSWLCFVGATACIAFAGFTVTY